MTKFFKINEVNNKKIKTRFEKNSFYSYHKRIQSTDWIYCYIDGGGGGTGSNGGGGGTPIMGAPGGGGKRMPWFSHIFEGGGGILSGSILNANWRKNCLVSLFQWVQNLESCFSTSLLGTLNAIVSYGSAAKSKYCHLRSGGSIFCS